MYTYMYVYMYVCMYIFTCLHTCQICVYFMLPFTHMHKGRNASHCQNPLRGKTECNSINEFIAQKKNEFEYHQIMKLSAEFVEFPFYSLTKVREQPAFRGMTTLVLVVPSL